MSEPSSLGCKRATPRRRAANQLCWRPAMEGGRAAAHWAPARGPPRARPAHLLPPVRAQRRGRPTDPGGRGEEEKVGCGESDILSAGGESQTCSRLRSLADQAGRLATGRAKWAGSSASSGRRARPAESVDARAHPGRPTCPAGPSSRAQALRRRRRRRRRRCCCCCCCCGHNEDDHDDQRQTFCRPNGSK